MKKNVASQSIGAQMINATTGEAFTGAVTVYVTGDNGTQAVGSVGSGACAHEGNGYHSYAPAQAETNYDHVAFTFIGTGAVPVTIQVFTSFPQTGDNFARLGAPAGASVSADVAAVKAETASIQADTNTVDDFLDTEIAAMKAVIDKLDTAVELDGAVYRFTTNALEQGPSGGSPPTAAAIADAVWDEVTSGHLTVGSYGNDLISKLVDANTKADAIQSVVTAINAITSTGCSLSAAERATLTDTILDKADSIETGLTLRKALRLLTAIEGGVLEGAATNEIRMKNAVANSKVRVTATVDEDGNRSGFVTDLT